MTALAITSASVPVSGTSALVGDRGVVGTGACPGALPCYEHRSPGRADRHGCGAVLAVAGAVVVAGPPLGGGGGGAGGGGGVMAGGGARGGGVGAFLDDVNLPP